MLARLGPWSRLAASVLVCATMVGSCSAPKRPATAHVDPLLHGEASYYARPFHGRKTASGDRFDMYALTAAHRRLAFGTNVRVTNLENGRKIVVRINDRGPYFGERVIDLSYGAARKLDMVESGVVPVDIEILLP